MKKAENKEKKPKKKKREKFVDDGHPIADMNVEGFPWYRGKNYNPDAPKPPKLTFKERWAVFKGAFASMLPPMLCLILGFGIIAVLMWLWLKGCGR